MRAERQASKVIRLCDVMRQTSRRHPYSHIRLAHSVCRNFNQSARLFLLPFQPCGMLMALSQYKRGLRIGDGLSRLA